LQRCCNIFAVDRGRRAGRNGGMMIGASISGSSAEFRAPRRAADPRRAAQAAETRENGETPENAENRENAENGETRKSVNMASAPNDQTAAPTLETRQHETPPASCSSPETVKQAPGRPRRTTPRTACETLKQHRKTQAGEGVGCFTPISPAGPPETVPCRIRAARETVKHPAPTRRVRETAKTRKTVKRLKTVKTTRTARNGRLKAAPSSARPRGPVAPRRPLTRHRRFAYESA